jgi:hypothetical protein
MTIQQTGCSRYRALITDQSEAAIKRKPLVASDFFKTGADSRRSLANMAISGRTTESIGLDGRGRARWNTVATFVRLFQCPRRLEKKSIGLIPFRRDTFVRVSTILIEAHVIKEAISQLRGRRLADPTGHDTIDWTDGPFLCEYPWRNTWRADCSLYEDGDSGSLPSIRYIRPVARHRWESPLDASLQDGASVYIPIPWLGDKLGLRPNLDHVEEFMAETNRQTVFIDPTVGISDASAALVDKERFFRLLNEEGLECLWIVAGERNAWPSGNPSDYACRSFASVYRWTGKKWVGSKWHKDRERR